MPTTNSTEKLRLSQYVGEDPVNFLQNYNNDMAKVDEGTLDVQTYDPDGVEGNAFRATNHKMTGYSKYSTYTPVLPSDTTAGAIGKLEAGVGSAGDMLAGTYDPMGVQADVFSAANQKMTDYQKPSAYSDIAATDNVRAAIGKLEARPIGDMQAQSFDPTGEAADAGGIKALIDLFVPAGTIFTWPAEEAPQGFVLCDGAAYDRVEKERLYRTIGLRFGVGDGSTTFNVPDMRNRFPLGYDANLGASGGEANHTISLTELLSHSHEVRVNNQPLQALAQAGSGGWNFNVNGAAIDSKNTLAAPVGGGKTHNNMPLVSTRVHH